MTFYLNIYILISDWETKSLNFDILSHKKSKTVQFLSFVGLYIFLLLSQIRRQKVQILTY